MTAIRPIKSEEAPAFLELLCEVFGLDLERAQGIFFNEPMFDLHRKWALFEGNEIISILTTVPLEFGWGRAFGIAGVATREERRGEGFAGRLLDRVCEVSKREGEGAAYLLAKEPEVYRRNGFEVIDEVIKGPLAWEPETEIPPMMDFGSVERRYAEWAERDPNRLRRDEQRWRYWKWNLRICTEFGDGYLVSEGGMVREVVSTEPVLRPWALPPQSEWLGLASVTEAMEVPIESRKFELHLMARGTQERPFMFMTDQF